MDRFLVVLTITLGIVFAVHLAGGFETGSPPPPRALTPTPAPTPAPVPLRYSLTTSISPSGNGTISPSSGTYDSGTVVTLMATPSSGYQFDHWSGDASGTSPSIKVTMNSDKSVVANFSSPRPPTTISINTDASWKSLDATVTGWTSAAFDDSWWSDSSESGYLEALPQAKGIWYPGTPVPQTAYFRKSLDINGGEVISGRVHVVICGLGWWDGGKVFIYINDQYVDKVTSGGLLNDWWREKGFDITPYLSLGKNVIAVKVEFDEMVKPPPLAKYSWWGLNATVRYK